MAIEIASLTNPRPSIWTVTIDGEAHTATNIGFGQRQPIQDYIAGKENVNLNKVKSILTNQFLFEGLEIRTVRAGLFDSRQVKILTTAERQTFSWKFKSLLSSLASYFSR